MGHVLDIFNHPQKLLVDLGVIFVTKSASNMDTSHILIDGSGKLVDSCEPLRKKCIYKN